MSAEGSRWSTAFAGLETRTRRDLWVIGEGPEKGFVERSGVRAGAVGSDGSAKEEKQERLRGATIACSALKREVDRRGPAGGMAAGTAWWAPHRRYPGFASTDREALLSAGRRRALRHSPRRPLDDRDGAGRLVAFVRAPSGPTKFSMATSPSSSCPWLRAGLACPQGPRRLLTPAWCATGRSLRRPFSESSPQEDRPHDRRHRARRHRWSDRAVLLARASTACQAAPQTRSDNAWSQIESRLKRRHDSSPPSWRRSRATRARAGGTFEAVTQARANAITAPDAGRPGPGRETSERPR